VKTGFHWVSNTSNKCPRQTNRGHCALLTVMNETALANLTIQRERDCNYPQRLELHLRPQVYSPHHLPINTQLIVNEVTLLPDSVPHNNRS